MTFQNPVWFLPALLLPGVLFILLKRRPPTILIGDIRPFLHNPGNRPRARFFHPVKWPNYFFMTGILCLLTALARPQRVTEHRIREFAGVDIIMVLDLSGSMRYLYDGVDEDFVQRPLPASPSDLGIRSRIDLAQEELARFTARRGNDRLGLIAFAGTAYIVSPLTYDHQYILDQLHWLDQIALPDGTEIAGPIVSAVARLKDSESPGRVIVLFSDGEDNLPFAVTPRQAAGLAAEFEINIHTVGIGGGRTFGLRNTLSGPVLEPTAETYDRELLQAMADLTGGQFFPAEDEAGLAAAVEQIDRLITGTFEQPVRYEYRDLYFGWALAGWLLLTAGLVMESTWCRTLP